MSDLYIGRRIKSARVGMTQRELARKAHVPVSVIMRLEARYARYVRLEELNHLAKALGIKRGEVVEQRVGDALWARLR